MLHRQSARLLLSLFLPALCFAEGSPELGYTQGLQGNQLLYVRVQAGDQIQVCSSDDGFQDEGVDLKPGEPSPTSSEIQPADENTPLCNLTNCELLPNRCRNQQQSCGSRLLFEKRKGAEIVAIPPKPTMCTSDADCAAIEGATCRYVNDGLPISNEYPSGTASRNAWCALSFAVEKDGVGHCTNAKPEPSAWHEITADSAGDWMLNLVGEPETIADGTGASTRYFDVRVKDREGNALKGRLHTPRWIMHAHSFATETESYGTNAKFYVLSPVGSNAYGADGAHVFKIDFDDLSGFRFQLFANNEGIKGHSGQSWCQFDSPTQGENGITCPTYAERHSLAVAEPDYQIYLNYPTPAFYSAKVPEITNAKFEDSVGSISISPNGDGRQDVGWFKFDSNIPGTGLVIVDTDQDGVFDPMKDWSKRKNIVAGSNTVMWDGTDINGNFVGDGWYSFEIRVMASETHMPMIDIEKNSKGFTISKVSSYDASFEPTAMFWNDTAIRSESSLVNANDVLTTWPNGSSENQRRYWEQRTAAGVLSEDGLDDMPMIFDTWAYGNVSVQKKVTCLQCESDGIPSYPQCDEEGCNAVRVVYPSGDCDGPACSDEIWDWPDPMYEDEEPDGIPTWYEREIGTDPTKCDTDGDGLCDGVEIGVDLNGEPIEGATITDPLNPDTDGDGIPDGVEDANHNGIFDDGETNPRDPDTDRDCIPDGEEDANHNGVVDEGETDPRVFDEGHCKAPVNPTDPNKPGNDAGLDDTVGFTGTNPADCSQFRGRDAAPLFFLPLLALLRRRR